MAASLRDRDDEPVRGTVGAGTVPGVLAVRDDHVAVVERQPWPLELRKLILAGVRHRLLFQLNLPREQVEPEEAMRGLHAIGRGRAFDQSVSVDEDFVASQVDDRRTCDADLGRDVAARQIRRRHGGREVASTTGPFRCWRPRRRRCRSRSPRRSARRRRAVRQTTARRGPARSRLVAKARSSVCAAWTPVASAFPW